ncbi:MAG: hypothetical protein WD896_02460 [Parcubacteria group bacterium]
MARSCPMARLTSLTSRQRLELRELRADLISYGTGTLGFSQGDAERTAGIAVDAVFNKPDDD